MPLFKWKNRSGTPTYGSWRRMKDRCTNPKNKDFIHYGGRGITICDRWLNNYDAFFDDMGEAPKYHKIDRIDNNGNYEPGNCRWATQKEQTNNTRRNRILEFDNKRLNITQWSNELNIPIHNIANRLKKNMPLELVLSTKKLGKKRKTQRIHGSYYSYIKYKCRCSLCIEAKEIKYKKIANKKKEFKNLRIVPEWYHGTSKGYDLCKCRCDECLEYYEYKKGRNKRPD